MNWNLACRWTGRGSLYMSMFAAAWLFVAAGLEVQSQHTIVLHTAGYVISAAIVMNMVAIVVLRMAIGRDERQIPSQGLLKQHLLMVLQLVLLCFWGAMLVLGSLRFL